MARKIAFNKESTTYPVGGGAHLHPLGRDLNCDSPHHFTPTLGSGTTCSPRRSPPIWASEPEGRGPPWGGAKCGKHPCQLSRKIQQQRELRGKSRGSAPASDLPTLPSSGTFFDPKWSKNSIFLGSKNGPKMTPKWPPNGPKMAQKVAGVPPKSQKDAKKIAKKWPKSVPQSPT